MVALAMEPVAPTVIACASALPQTASSTAGTASLKMSVRKTCTVAHMASVLMSGTHLALQSSVSARQEPLVRSLRPKVALSGVCAMQPAS
jgi:hypothetical protein